MAVPIPRRWTVEIAMCGKPPRATNSNTRPSATSPARRGREVKQATLADWAASQKGKAQDIFVLGVIARAADQRATLRTSMPALVKLAQMSIPRLRRSIDRLCAAGYLMAKPWAEGDMQLGHFLRIVRDSRERSAARRDGFESCRTSISPARRSETPEEQRCA